MAEPEPFSGLPKWALLQVIMPFMPLSTISLGLAGEIVALTEYSSRGMTTELIVTIVFMVIPIVIHLIATLAGYEEAKENDPEIIQNNLLIRAIYYAFHIKIFHMYFKSLISAALGLCCLATVDPDKQNPKNVCKATLARRYLAFTGVAPQVVFQMYVLYSWNIANGGPRAEDAAMQFAVSGLVISMGCAMAQHHTTDCCVCYDDHWSAPIRICGTALVFAWKIFLVVGRAIVFSLFLHQFGALIVIPVLLHGIIVLLLYKLAAEPKMDSFANFMKSLILSYMMMYDMNDVWLNEIKGKRTVQFCYYGFRLIADVALIIPWFMLTTAYDYLKIASIATVFGCYGAAILIRVFYYLSCHPKTANAEA